MDRITIYDVHKRLKSLDKSCQSNLRCRNEVLESSAIFSIEKQNPKMIIRSIEDGNRTARNQIRFETTLALFDALYECGTTGQLRKAATVVIEEAIPKVRNAKDTNTNLKRKLGRLKGKITNRVGKNIEDAQNTVKAKIHNVKKNLKTNTTQIKTNVKTGLGMKDDKPTPKDEAYIQFYESFIATLDKYIECDRILENYESISKRFNLEKVLIDNTPVNGVMDSTNKICSYAESYDMPDAIKYNTTLETMWYGFERYGIPYDRKQIVEAATDYFCTKKNGYSNCIEILQNSSIFSPEDLPDNMQIITELDPEDPNYNIFQRIDQIHQEIRESYYGAEGRVYTENVEFNKIFSDYKKSNEPDDGGKFMQLTRRLYTKSVSNIADGTPAYLTWIRRVGVLGTFSINPILGCIAVIGDIFATLHFERTETEKMQRCFEKEIKESQKKLDSSNDKEEQQRLEKYIESLEKTKDKIDQYYESMLSEKELDDRYNDDTEESDSSNDDSDWDDDFEDFDEAASVIYTAGNAADTVEHWLDDNTIGVKTITNMSIFNGDDIDSLAKLSVEYPDVWSPELMECTIESISDSIRNRRVVFDSNIEKYNKLFAYDTAIKTLRENNPVHPSGITSLICLAECLEALELIQYTEDNRSVMIEASISNTLKLASEKLKKGLQNLSDKEKTISKNIDVTMGNVTKAAERAITNDNREAVIKGSLIPSASKVIKLAITTGAIWLVQPAAAVITALGYVALMKGQQHKERQLILDEIDTELKMCDEYIDLAKSKNDMKALKQLYQTRKKLQREQQRIQYHMKVTTNKDIPSTAD